MNERKDAKGRRPAKRSSKRNREKRRRLWKKRILRFLRIVLIFLTVGMLFGILKFLEEKNIVSVMSSEIEIPWIFAQTDIVLDAGHGGKDQGAGSADAVEKEITLAITKKTEDILKKAGYKVKLTRENDTFVELGERAEYANRREAKIFVSIHCNSSEDGEGNGIETFYSEYKGEESRQLAQCIQEQVITHTKARDREVRTADYTVIVRTDMPAALVETGFLNHEQERELLQQEDYQEKLAQGIAEGIMRYLEE